jgi:tetratricopeptide (TPR) repeat protein
MFVLFLLWTFSSSAQTDVNKDIDLTRVYEQVVKEGYGTPEIHLKLANEYYFQNNYAKAKEWFEKVFENEKPTDKMILFRYKQTLKALNVSFERNKYLAISGTN